jgi:predicted ester cyclase
MSAEMNKALIATLFEGMNRNDFAPLDDHPGFYETRQYVPPLHHCFTDWQTTGVQQIAEGDLVCTYTALAFTHSGPFAGLAPTGRRVSLKLLSVDQLRDGVVIAHNSTGSWPDTLRQLGAPAFATWPAQRSRLPTQTHDAQPESTLRANKTAVLSALGGLGRGEFFGVTDAPGLNELVDRFVELRRAFPDLALTPLLQIAEGDLVATRASLHGTHLGALYGLPANGQALSWDFFSLARVAGGVVVEQVSLFDWNDLLARLGLLA